MRFRCPKCGEGRVFSSFFRMRDECPVCGLSFCPESGYYVGAMYFDYILSAGIFLVAYVPSLFMRDITHFSYMTKNLLWIAFATFLCLGLARPSYSLWLAADYWITPWKSKPAEKKDEGLEVPLLSLTIRSDSGERRNKTPHDTES
ncbi:MAG TPA: DUF983 domain-containing protein [Candidatus Acidoferrales bacterium]|nr:DUF983 domain-containing protein [Candidatus Acidoferrales bacterium]